MLSASVARRYARALFDLARERGQVEEVGREVEQVVEAMRASRELRGLWEHQEVSPRLKCALLEQHFKGKVSDLVLHFLFLLVAKRREVWLPRILREYVALADEALGRVEVEVRSAVPLPDEVLDRLAERLRQRLGKEVRFVRRVDPSLLGGLVVRVGDVLMDGSVRTQLRRMQQRLVGAGGNG
nr:MAG: F0F1 ATP synthase subunit delta [Bacillota bacterium]